MLSQEFKLKLMVSLSRRGLLKIMSDRLYIKLMYRIRMQKKLNLKHPCTFNEKLQWLKLNNRKNEYSLLVDKFEVKQYVADIIGEDHVIPTIGIWSDFDNIDFTSLPDQFVLKTTHDSGGVCVCDKKKSLDIDAIRAKIVRSMKRNYYWHTREWPYKNVTPRIIAEPYVKDGDNEVLPVYKFLCFGGKPKIIQTIQNDKQPTESIDYFDTDWNLLHLRQNYPNSKKPFSKPKQLEAMLEIATKLAQGYEFIRVDLYLINGKVKFSEYTFFSDAGMAKFEPEEWDVKLGELIDLSRLC